MAANVCISRTCLHKQGPRGISSSMRPVLETSQLRCYTTPSSYHSNSYKMASRGSGMEKGAGFEGKGLLLLLICGFYAILLFIIARIVNYAVGRVTSSVKSVICHVDVTKATMITKESADDNNNGIVTKQKRQQTRSICHG